MLFTCSLYRYAAAREKGAKHFVLLSAICVQKPLLTFQKAKLKFEVGLCTSVCCLQVESSLPVA
jgi:hypothetical protein